MGSQALPANLLQRELLSPWVHGPWQEPAPLQALHGVTAFFRPIHLLQRGVLDRLQVDISSTMDLHGLRVAAYLTVVFTTGYRGISALVPRAPAPFPSSLTLVSAELFLSHVLSPACCCAGVFPFLNRGTTAVADGLGLGQCRVRLEAGWHWLYQTWWKLLAASHRIHPCSP